MRPASSAWTWVASPRRGPGGETEPLRLPGPSGPLAAVLPRPAPAPLLIACHGLLSNTDSPKYVLDAAA